MSLPGRFLSRLEVEPRIAKQHKCHHCCSCKKYRGKGMEGGKKSVFVSFLGGLDDREFVREKKEKCFGASYSTSNKLLPVARHILTAVRQKCL